MKHRTRSGNSRLLGIAALMLLLSACGSLDSGSQQLDNLWDQAAWDAATWD